MVVIGKSLKDYTYDELEQLTGNILTNKEFEELKENPLISIEEIGKVHTSREEHGLISTLKMGKGNAVYLYMFRKHL